MSYPILKPLSHGQIIDRAVRLYRNNFLKFVGIAAAVFVPLQLLTMAISLASMSGLESFLDVAQNPDLADDDFLASMLSAYTTLAAGQSSLGIVTTFFKAFATAAIAGVAASAYLGQKAGGIGDAYRAVFDKVGNIIVTLIFILIGGIIIGIWTIVPLVGWFTGPGMIFVFTLVLTPLAYVIIMTENKSGQHALRRGWDLIRRRFWPLIGFMLLLSLFAYIVVLGPQAVVSGLIAYFTGIGSFTDVLNPAESFSNTMRVQTVVSTLVSAFFQILYLPLAACVSVVLYYDLRVRSEGFDLTLQAENGAEEKRPITDFLLDAPAPETTSVLTGKELGRFAGMSFGCIVVFVALYAVLVAIVFAVASSLGGF